MSNSPNKEPECRTCVACYKDFESTEEMSRLVKPCRFCNADYCQDCLRDMFTTKDVSRMPPRCCALIQPYMASSSLSVEELNCYRERFEEWMTVDGNYCPSATCSAFISPRHLKNFNISSKGGASCQEYPTIQIMLRTILKRVQNHPASRFFRSSTRFENLPAYHAKVKVHMDLSVMQNKVDSSYRSVGEMATDFRLMYENAKRYNGKSTHPVVQAAEQLVAQFQKELSAEVSTLIARIPRNPENQIFSCPKCHIAICATCRQIEHTGKPCDRSKEDQELAMLQQLGYKRCPKCRIGVKKMFGCPHMLCRCGAHWCYYCEKSIEACQGSCDPDGESSEGEEDDDEEDNNDDEDNEGVVNNDDKNGNQKEAKLQIDLDRGGSRRWNTGDFDFGSDPGEQPQGEIWNCDHDFVNFVPKQDEFNRGDLSQLDCNLCFVKLSLPAQPALVIRPRRTYASVVAGKRKRHDPKSDTIAEPVETLASPKGSPKALECALCAFIVCDACHLGRGFK